jgi:hypothetical protein
LATGVRSVLIAAKLAELVHANLAKQGIDGTARPIAGRGVELRAEKQGKTERLEFVCVLRAQEIRRRGPSAVAEDFCAQAINALAKIDAK